MVYEIPQKKPRTGSINIRINRKFYEIPKNTLLFKSHNNKDIYLSCIRCEQINKFKQKWIGIVRFIIEGKFEEVQLDLLDKFMINQHQKFLLDDEEYDIPYHLIFDFKNETSKLSKYNPKLLKDLKEKYKEYLYKNN